jgi:pimeloyl-ACP methyl ester carboxylesterase
MPRQSVVAIVPGIMASTLTQGTSILWSDNMFANYQMIRKNSSLLQWAERAATAKLWRRVAFKPIPMIGFSLWSRTLEYFVKQNTTIVECPYDWRQSLRASARDIIELLKSSQGISQSLAEPAPADAARFDMVSHSMGGLLIRTAIGMQLLHPSWIAKILHLAPPLRGSPAAFRSVVDQTTLPVLNEFLKMVHLRNYRQFKNKVYDVFRGFHSIYELMPPQSTCFLYTNSGQPMDIGSVSQLDQRMVAEAKITHRYIAAAEPILINAGIPVSVIYTSLNNNDRTDFGYRFDSRAFSIDEVYASRNGDGTVHSDSATSSSSALNRPVFDLAHMKIPNTRRVVDLYPTCGF